MKTTLNGMTVIMPAKSVNESTARGIVTAFVTPLDPTLEELCDIRTAVSEAVTNCVVHAYREETDERKKTVMLKLAVNAEGLLTVVVRDKGCGIPDIARAMQPMYTGTEGEERSGMGFSIMQCFCDAVSVRCGSRGGTTVTLKKYIGHDGAPR